MLTLALGIGAAVGLLSVVEAAWLRPLPYPAPHELVRVYVEESRGAARPRRTSPSFADVQAWNASGVSIRSVAIKLTMPSGPVFDAGVPQRVRAAIVSEEYFRLFGVWPDLGRGFTSTDCEIGAPSVIVISHGFWVSRFGADRSVIGRIVRVDGTPTEVIGVLPSRFGEGTEVWQPLRVPPSSVGRRTAWEVYGRVVEDASLDGAASQLTALLQSDVRVGQHNRVTLVSLLQTTRGDHVTTLRILAGVSGVILLLAIANVSGLGLARSAARTGEFAIRAALGAGRWQLARQVLTESLAITAVGGLIGLGLAGLFLDDMVILLGVTMPPDSPPRISPLVLLASSGLVLLAALLVALVPVLRLPFVRPSQVLARSGRDSGVRFSRRVGQAFITVQVALAAVLLVGMGLMLASFLRLISKDIGFSHASLVYIEVQPVSTSPESVALYYPALVRTIRDLPNVAAAGAADSGPLGRENLVIFGTARSHDGRLFDLAVRTTVPGYLDALEIPVLAGRLPVEADMTTDPVPVVINQRAAQEIFGEHVIPVGQSLEVNSRAGEVVGVIGDTRSGGPEGEFQPEAYIPLRLDGPALPSLRPMTVVVKPRAWSPALARELREIAAAPSFPVVIDRVARGTEMFGDAVRERRHRTTLVAVLGLAGLFLAMVGVLGITAHAVGQRRHEVGVRLAVGGQAGQVVRTVMRDSVVAVLAGVVIGTGAALFGVRLLETFLFQTDPADPMAFMVVAASLGFTGVIAAWLPAHRAVQGDPLYVLRSDAAAASPLHRPVGGRPV